MPPSPRPPGRARTIRQNAYEKAYGRRPGRLPRHPPDFRRNLLTLPSSRRSRFDSVGRHKARCNHKPEANMSNASRSRAAAARYAKLAENARDGQTRRAYSELERLWQEMARMAEVFDTRRDGEARERIYAMVDAVEEHRRKLA
jgi:hypothetical protein